MATIWRGGISTDQVRQEDARVELLAPKGAKWLRLVSMIPAGQGHTAVHIELTADDFSPIIEAMLAADRRAALSALCQHLSKELSAGAVVPPN